MAASLSAPGTGPIPPLTPRQAQVAAGIVRGLRYAEIGRELRCSEHTVRVHVRQIAVALRGLDEFPPRMRILVWAKQQEWESVKPAEQSLSRTEDRGSACQVGGRFLARRAGTSDFGGSD